MRRKARKKNNKGCLGFLLVLVAVAGAIAVMLLTPLFDITTINISGNAVVATDVIQNAAAITIGQNIFRVNVGAAQKNIEALQYVDSVKVSRRLPSTIDISVKEGTIAAYINANGTYVGISDTGKILNTVAPTQSEAGRPVIEGLEIESPTIGAYYKAVSPKKAQTVAKFISEFTSMGIIGEITEINVTLSENISFCYNTHLLVNFGTAEEFEYKLRFFERLLSSQIGTEARGVVNMENPDKITFRDASQSANDKKDEKSADEDKKKKSDV